MVGMAIPYLLIAWGIDRGVIVILGIPLSLPWGRLKKGEPTPEDRRIDTTIS
jgi:hypothetical protein